MYECIHNEQEQTLTIRLKQGDGNFWIGVFIAGLFALGAISIFYGGVSVGGILFAAFVIGPTIVFTIWLLYKANKHYFLLSEEGISSVEPKQQQYLRWDECNFIGIYDFRVSCSSPGLIISKHVPQRDKKGEIPRQYPWPREETMNLTNIWCYLSEEDQQKILSFCGGMRG